MASKDFSENLLEKSEKDGSELDIAVVVVVVVADEARDEKMTTRTRTIFTFVSINVSPNGTLPLLFIPMKPQKNSSHHQEEKEDAK